MTHVELLSALSGLRQAQIGNRRAPHQPLLMLWPFGRLLYVARSAAGRAMDVLHGQQAAAPRPGRPTIASQYLDWHEQQVFKRPGAQAAQAGGAA